MLPSRGSWWRTDKRQRTWVCKYEEMSEAKVQVVLVTNIKQSVSKLVSRLGDSLPALAGLASIQRRDKGWTTLHPRSPELHTSAKESLWIDSWNTPLWMAKGLEHTTRLPERGQPSWGAISEHVKSGKGQVRVSYFPD